MKKLKIFIIFLSIIAFVSCSDDDPVSPSEKPVNSVIIDPVEVTFNAIGQNIQFTAKAYDATGGEVSTALSWESSNTEVIVIGTDGMAEATGLGNAKIYVTAGEKSDTANVIVELTVEPEIWWDSATSGNWNDATKWSTGEVPEADDTVAITLEGDYTVTLTSDVTITHITLGAATGIQKLSTGENLFTIENGTLTGGAELEIDGTTIIKGNVNWNDGAITGNGTLDIYRQAKVIAGIEGNGSNLTLKSTIMNSGTFAILPGATVVINGGTLENKSSAKIDLRGDNASFSPVRGGTIMNSGDLVKSAGDGAAYIHSSGPGDFVNSMYIKVESGTLHIRDGDLAGVIVIEEDAVLRQSGNTLIRTGLANYSRGGMFEIGGTITLGEEAGDLIRLHNIVLDSYSSNSITGPGDLNISGSFLWYRGTISGAGEILTYGDVRLEGSSWKQISERTFIIEESLETESGLDLRLSDDAQMLINRSGHWIHNGGGKIVKGTGNMSAINIIGVFTKEGTGGLTIETDFSCEGTMNLYGDVLTVKGAFKLQESGTIVGGDTDTDIEYNYRKLQVPEATSAILAGTIDIDANGELAFLSIFGPVTLEETFKILIDIDKNNELIPAERLVFLAGQVNMKGTLDFNILGSPPDNVEYRVVQTVDATGEFTNFTGNGAGYFHEIQQDDKGVLLIRN